MNPFKKLRGRTILVSVPERKKSALELSAKDEEAMMQEAAKLWSKLTVYATGDKVEEVSVGDEVYVRTSALNMETVERLYRIVRPQAKYERSLEQIKRTKELGLRTKSGIMLGLGETQLEVEKAMDDLLV